MKLRERIAKRLGRKIESWGEYNVYAISLGRLGYVIWAPAIPWSKMREFRRETGL